eukprot:15460209-Alexandrium_andersonii.AAC.1
MDWRRRACLTVAPAACRCATTPPLRWPGGPPSLRSSTPPTCPASECGCEAPPTRAKRRRPRQRATALQVAEPPVAVSSRQLVGARLRA